MARAEVIGFIGLGVMGSRIAANIQAAGYSLVVYDARPEAANSVVERGARRADCPAEVARKSDVIFTSLPGPREVEDVAAGPRGILEGIRSGGIYVDLSTSQPTLTRRLDAMFRKAGAAVLDAPVSGGKSGAATRNLAVLVGGERALYERIRPVLESFGDKVFYAGAVGAGNVCKLVHNMMGFRVVAGHRGRPDRRREGRGRAEGSMGMRASGRSGPDECPSRSHSTQDISS
jgi:3-hydroxyisobutyrate dehydrogenase